MQKLNGSFCSWNKGSDTLTFMRTSKFEPSSNSNFESEIGFQLSCTVYVEPVERSLEVL